jgi:hypothetical protein
MPRNPAHHWPASAITLALAIACSPQAPSTSVEAPQPGGAASAEALPQPPAPVTPAAPATPPPPVEVDQPGYAGSWAAVRAECADPTKALHLAGDVIDISVDKRNCGVTSLKEEHPTGRSMIYRIAVDCEGEGGETKHNVTLNFGAADTIVQMQVDDGPAARLERCP